MPYPAPDKPNPVNKAKLMVIAVGLFVFFQWYGPGGYAWVQPHSKPVAASHTDYVIAVTPMGSMDEPLPGKKVYGPFQPGREPQ